MRSLRMPAGTLTCTMSPFFLLMRACAMGDLTEIFPSLMLASWVLTMVNLSDRFLLRSVSSTLLSNYTVSALRLVVSSTRALARMRCLKRMRPNSLDCSLLAARYS